MNELIINYILYSSDDAAAEQLLGVEKYVGFKEKLIPNYSVGSHPVTISKIFEGHDFHRWQVKNLIHKSNHETSVFIEPRVSSLREEFLSQTKIANNHVMNRLQFATLVEVEFGYIPVVKKLNGDLIGNKRYPDTIHKGEMHKRRLCLVVKADGGRVQVVPVTSQGINLEGDLSVFELSFASLQDLTAYNNNAITSFGLCKMIKTVSISRVLPPLALHGRTTSPYRDNSYRKKLNSIDIKKFKKSLSHAVGLTDYYHLKEKASEYFNELEILKPENKSLNEEMEVLLGKQSAYEEMEKRYDVLLEIMTDWRRGVSGDNVETARAHIEKEIIEYDDILSGN